MQNLASKQAPTYLAHHPHHLALCELFYLAPIEVEEAQSHAFAVFFNIHKQVFTWADHHLAARHHALNLHMLTGSHGADGNEPGFVLIAHRQMQDQI